MDRQGTALGTVTAPLAHLARNRHAGRAAEDLAQEQAQQLRLVAAIVL